MSTPHLLLPLLILVACHPDERQADVVEVALHPADSIDLEPHGFFMVTSLAKSDSSFYLIDRTRKLLAKTTLDFQPTIKYGSIGAGPGEFTDPFDLSFMDDRVYVIDFSQRKLMEFSKDLKPIDELFSEYPPFSVLAVGEREVMIGTFDMEFEDVFNVDFGSRNQVRHPLSLPVDVPLEGIALHSRHKTGVSLRYRLYTNRLDVFDSTGNYSTFPNWTQPERPEMDTRIPEAPLFTSRIHHSAFLTPEFACVLSGDHRPGNQPVQCFDFDGTLVARYVLKQGPSMISVYSDSTLYTYSPKTNHVYVYHLGF